jgi:hypothetical protein
MEGYEVGGCDVNHGMQEVGNGTAAKSEYKDPSSVINGNGVSWS